MLEVILTSLLLGISTGPSCLILCTPFYLPYLVAEKRKLKANFLELGIFLLGRLIGYLIFGLIIGYLGQQLNIGWVNIVSTVSLGILALLIILYGLNFFKYDICAFKSFHQFIRKWQGVPFSIGLLTGINLCPPFLLSLNYVFILGDIFKGVIYFFFFFLATSIYFVPLIFLGKLSYIKEFQILARWTMVIVGVIFFCYAVYSLVTHQYISHVIS